MVPPSPAFQLLAVTACCRWPVGLLPQWELRLLLWCYRNREGCFVTAKINSAARQNCLQFSQRRVFPHLCRTEADLRFWRRKLFSLMKYVTTFAAVKETRGSFVPGKNCLQFLQLQKQSCHCDWLCTLLNKLLQSQLWHCASAGANEGTQYAILSVLHSQLRPRLFNTSIFIRPFIVNTCRAPFLGMSFERFTMATV